MGHEFLGNYWWGLLLLGFVAGIVSGTLGLGSGTIVIPALVLLFAVPQKSAQGTALAVMVPMALLGALRYWKNPDIELSLGLVGLLACGALVGTLAGTELAGWLSASALRKIFAVMLLVIALRMLFAPDARRKGTDNKPVDSNPPALVGPERGALNEAETGNTN